MMRLPYRLVLFLVAFMMLQFCAFQMSAQAYSLPQHEMHETTVAASHSPEHGQSHQQSDQHHSKKGMACSVSGCVVPVPVPPAMVQLDLMPRILTAPYMQALHGLPPALSDRPPISVFA